MILQQNNICPICQNSLYFGDYIHADHIIPIAKGGKDSIENIQITHANCNLKKGSK
jgi:5-methylcytosine-specific restriction protein A